jgi:hypothetical protein
LDDKYTSLLVNKTECGRFKVQQGGDLMGWLISWIAISIAIGAYIEVEVKNRKLEKRIKVLEDKIK